MFIKVDVAPDVQAWVIHFFKTDLDFSLGLGYLDDIGLGLEKRLRLFLWSRNVGRIVLTVLGIWMGR